MRLTAPCLDVRARVPLLAATLCALGGLTPYPVQSALRYFPEDFGLEPAAAAGPDA